MDEQKKYNPKYMREPEEDLWDQGSWQTGSTEPPKSRSSIIAGLLILIIFLCGVITVLGVLNVKMFQELNYQHQEELNIAFVEDQPQAVEYAPPSTAATEPTQQTLVAEDSVSIYLHQAPQAMENIPQEGSLSLQEIYQKNIDSVVSISCVLKNGTSTGTGVILTEDGYIVTNAHVVEDATAIDIRLTDNRTFPAGIVGTDQVSDLAVLFIEAAGLDPAEFGDSANLQVGDSVTAIGDPLGVELRGTYTDGIISAINRDVAMDGRTMTLIQTNAAMNSGNSGGPLINCFGQVIGINTMKIGAFSDKAGVEGLGFAIPSATVKDIVDQIIRQGYVSGRPSLGITGDALSTFYQHYYHLPAGLYITAVEAGSYAAFHGIQPGDILLQVDDTRITDVDSLNAVLYSHEVGDVVTVVIYRGGRQAIVDLTLTEDKG